MALQKPQTCRTCIGYPWGGCRGYSRVTGSGKIPLLLLGEASGAVEERRGEPFIGQAGEVLDRAIKLAGLNRDDYSVTNTIRCRPPENKLLGMPYERAALDHCRQYLDEVVAERHPQIILALGDIPLREVSAVPGSQSSLRGYCLSAKHPGVSVIGTFHPSRILRGDWHLFGVLIHDLKRANQYATRGIPTRVSTNYNLSPAKADLLDYLARLDSDRSLAVAYDLETKAILKLLPPDEIIQVQFSSGVGEALVVPFDEAHRWFIDAVFATPNMKLGWNSRGFDTPLLKRNGIVINGENHDAMLMWAHSQSNFVSSKDEKDSDKRIPSRLLNLQAAVSFYYPQETPWKGVVEQALPTTGWGMYRTMSVLQHYGAVDADMTYRLGVKLIASLQKNGLWAGYYRFKYQLSKVLDDLGRRGLPVDREAQTELREYVRSEELRLLRELQRMVDPSLLSLHPEFGYVNPPKFVPEDYDAANPPLIELAASRGYLIQQLVTAEVTNYIEQECATCNGTGAVAGIKRPKKCPKCKATGKRMVKDGKISRDELRWGLSLFNPNSSDHVLNYLRWQCARDDRYFIPKHIDTGKDTTNKAGIEHLLMTVTDPILLHIEKCKKITKLGDYCSGSWVPGDDGRVHAEFRFGSAVNQTSAVNPPVQTYPKHYTKTDEWLTPIMHRIKATIKAQPGHKMVQVDMAGFHARMQGFLAEDFNYYRLANLDVHSFVTAHYVDAVDKDQLLPMSDAELKKRLTQIKQEHQHTRDFMVKRCSFLNQYGGSAEKAASILHLPVMEVEYVLQTIKNLFPDSFKKFPKWIGKQLRRNPALTTPFGCRRIFWDSDPLQAVAFWVANQAHCAIQDAILRLDAQGALEKYDAVNLMHDALWLHPAEDLVDECITVVQSEFERASEVLINKLGAFTCRSDAQVGDDMDSLSDYVVGVTNA
jgi:uracil-DNA glycosylase family 4